MNNPSPLNMPKRTVVRPIAQPALQSVVASSGEVVKATPKESYALWEKVVARVHSDVQAKISKDEQAKVVRPSGSRRTVLVTQADDGVRKAKQITVGQHIRPFVKGEARGGVRVVESVERLEDGAVVRLTFSSGHPTVEVKAAYRFVDINAIGRPVQVRVPAEPTFLPVHS